MRRRRVVAHSVGRLAVALAMGNALGSRHVASPSQPAGSNRALMVFGFGASGAPMAPPSERR